MNELMTTNKMTSMQIAEVTGKRHDHVLRDINDEMEKLQNAGLDTHPKFGLRTRTDSTGRKIPYFELTKEGVLQLAARYDAVVRAKLIEMVTRGEQPKVPQTFAEALRLAADLEEERQRLLPKADQYDKFISGENYQDMNTVAKTLNWGRNRLFAELRERKILMADNRPYQRYIDAGYFIVREKPIDMGGAVFNKPQTYVTSKGVSWLSRLLDDKTGIPLIDVMA